MLKGKLQKTGKLTVDNEQVNQLANIHVFYIHLLHFYPLVHPHGIIIIIIIMKVCASSVQIC